MASFQKLPFTFLLFTVLSDIQAGGGYLSCSKHNISELGKNINITCKNNAAIERMGVEFHPTRGSTTIVIHQQKGNSTLGKPTWDFNDSTACLIINQVKISDEGDYMLTYIDKNRMATLNLSLEVFAPYTSPQVIKWNDTLVCTASGGYPEKKLYWVSMAGTNLIHNSTSESVKNEDGSFNLSNTLHLESALSETGYCCTFNNTTVPSTPASACMTLESISFPMTTEKTTLKRTGLTWILLAVILLVFILLPVVWYRRKKGASSANFMNILQTYSSERRIFQLKEEFPL